MNNQLKQALNRPLIQYLFLFLIVMCVYLPTMWYTFVWDDYGMIAYNKSIREWENIPQFFTDPSTFVDSDPNEVSLFSWRPVRNIYFLVTYKLHGLRPAGWHLHQVLLHAILTLILLGFFRKIYRYATCREDDKPLSTPVQIATWAAVLIWAVHPANTEVIGWMKAADDILALILGITAINLLLPENGRPRLWAILGAATIYPLGLMTKESIPPLAAIYPMIIITLAPTLKSALNNRPAIIATAILAVETLIFIIVRDRLLGQSAQGGYLATNFSLMMATMTTAIVRYLQITFWPFWPTTQLGSYLTWPIAQSWLDSYVLTSCAIIAAFTIICAFIGFRRRIFLAGCIFTVLAFLPVANIIPMVQVLAERFMYFPLIGVALSFSFLLVWLYRHHFVIATWFSTGLIVALTITTELRLPVWIDELTFQKEVARANPADFRAFRNIGATLYATGETTASLPYFQHSLELPPPRNSPKFLQASYNYSTKQAALVIARIFLNQGKTTDSLHYVDKGFAAFPPTAIELSFRGDILRRNGQTTSALVTYQAAAKAGYDSPNLHVLLSNIYKTDNNEASATLEMQKAFAIDPRLKPPQPSQR